jgi:hypothetical protein
VLFNHVAGTWTVPAASRHTAGEAEYSSTWVGIGGGCIDAGCLLVDQTLIQTGTESDVDAAGNTTYFGWWEIIPGPAIRIPSFVVRPGDRMRGSLRQTVNGSNIWVITLVNITRGKTFTRTVPYASSRLTAEWITEAPLINGLQSTIPSLTNPRFNDARANNASARLAAADAIRLRGAAGLATPSNPDPDRNGFNVCTYATSCAAPTGT